MPKGGPPKRPKPKNTGRSAYAGMNPAESRAKFGRTRASSNAFFQEQKRNEATYDALFNVLSRVNSSGSGRRPPNAR
jgi:hypothetical protein